MNLLAGGLSGMAAMTATHPLERVKMMRIVGVKEIAGKNILSSIFTMVKLKGIKSILRGNKASWVREFPGAGLMFYFYEKFKSILIPKKGSNDSDLPYRVMSGAWAGMLSSTITYALDPVKAVMASDFDGKYGSMTNVLKNIYKKNGLKGFYHGYTATLWSVTPFIGKYKNSLLCTNSPIITIQKLWNKQVFIFK